MNDTCILGLHIAKTGGTSILYNFRTHTDLESYFNYGRNANVDRFFRGEPILEDMEISELLKIKFVFGHGVHEGLLRTLPHTDVALFCVFRDPYLHLISHLKHRIRMSAIEGRTIDTKTFLEQRGNNPASRFLVAHFPTLAGEGDLRTQVRRVLKHFRFVLSTDNLTQQSVGLFRMAGVPPLTSKRRVYPEEVDIPGLTREGVYEANQIDYEINEAINAIQKDPEQADSWNPCGYDADALSAVRDKMRSTISAEDQRQNTCLLISNQLKQQKSVLAAQEYARQSGMTGDLAAMIKTLPHPDRISPSGASSEQTNLARILHMGGKLEEAIAALEKAIELNNDNANAYYLLSRVYFDLHNRRLHFTCNGNLVKSLAMAEEASKRSPSRGDIEAHLGEIYLAQNDNDSAVKHFKKAVELAPDNKVFALKYTKISGPAG